MTAMGKKTIVAVSGAVLVGVLAGCAGASDSSDATSSTWAASTGRGDLGVPSAAPSTSVSVQPYPTGTTRPTVRGAAPVSTVKRSDPAAVAKGFVITLWSQDTAADTSPFNAQVRAAQLATVEFARELSDPAQAAPGAAWNALSAAHGYTTVQALELPILHDGTIDTPTLKSYTIQTTVTTHGGPPVPVQVFPMAVTVQRSSAGQWQVSTAQVQQ